METARTIGDLRQMQSLPLGAKINMTRFRVRQWVEEYGEDGVYISFSGGKDSTVLMDLVRNEFGYKSVPAVFVDVPTQFPELRDFAKTWDDVTIIKPKIGFMEVCDKYGFPLISKDVSQCVLGARKYLRGVAEKNLQEGTDEIEYAQFYRKISGLGEYAKSKEILEQMKNDRRLTRDGSPYRTARILDMLTVNGEFKNPEEMKDGERSVYSLSKWKFLLDAPFEISHNCCTVMKKEPLHTYNRRTKRHPITAQMADESRLRTQQWLVNGCNGFQMREPISNPMSF